MVSSNKKGENPLGVGLSEASEKFISSNEIAKSIFADKMLFNCATICLLFVILQVLILGLNIGKLPPQVPLFYSKTWGEEILASSFLVWLLPSTSLIIVLSNFLITLLLIKNYQFLSRALAIFTVVFVFCGFWVVFKLITLLV